MEHANNAVVELAKYLQESDSPDRQQIAEGAIWGIAAASGDDPETVRRQVDEARRRHPTVASLPDKEPENPPVLRVYAPGLYVTREAKVNAADPDKPPAPPNPNALSMNVSEELSRPLTEAERAEIDATPVASPEEIDAMLRAIGRGH